MASRRLAFSLNQALRSKQALRSIQPLKRNFATPVEPARTECTTLSNGLTVSFSPSPAQLNADTILDCDGALAMGSDVDRWRLDRCWQSSRDGQDKRHRTFPRASGFQGARHVILGLIKWMLTSEKGTNKRSQHQLELEIENMGGHLNAYTSVWPCACHHQPLTYLCSGRTLSTMPNPSTPTFRKRSTFYLISYKIRSLNHRLWKKREA